VGEVRRPAPKSSVRRTSSEFAEDARATELAQQLDALLGLWSALSDVAERDDQVDVVTRDVGERSTERGGVPVHVGEEGDAHSAELTDTP
jgi:hypothetical protein